MNLTVTPGKPLRGEVHLPGDKSISHRAALMAALAEGESRISNFLVSGVTRAMLGALSALKVPWELEGTDLIIRSGGIAELGAPRSRIDCGNSATTLRLLAGGLAAGKVPAILDGTAGLRRRPMMRIITPLQKMGVVIESTNGGAPLILKRSHFPLHAMDYTLPVASAQVKSCLLLAALAADGQTILREPGPSRDHTERMLRSLGIELTSELSAVTEKGALQYITCLEPPVSLHLPPIRMNLPGDFSAGAFLIVAALITPGSEIMLCNVGLNPTRTGLLDALSAMGGDIQVTSVSERNGEPVGDLIVRHSTLQGTQIQGPLVVRMIDEFPAFAIAAACAKGKTAVRQAEELRHKESDRIAAMCTELNKIGVYVRESTDGFDLQGGGGIEGSDVEAHGDHRLAMALAVAGLAAQKPITVHGADIIGESFPDFKQVLTNLGGHLISG